MSPPGLPNVWSRLAISGTARAFTSDGYFIVPASIRGAADTRANVQFVTGDVRLDHYTSIGNFFFKTSMLAEERQNGTVITHNSTGMGTISLRYAREFTNDSFSLLGFHTRSGFHATFDSVTNNRNTDRLTYSQTVPSDAVGGAVLWQHHEKKWNLMAGADADRLGGTSTDHVVPTGQRVGGGTQLQHGIFGQADAALGPVKLFAGRPSQLCRDGQPVPQPQRRIRRRQEEPARPRQRLSQLPRPHVERTLPRFQRGQHHHQGQPRPGAGEVVGSRSGRRLDRRELHLPRHRLPQFAGWPDYQRHALQYAHGHRPPARQCRRGQSVAAWKPNSSNACTTSPAS